MLKLIKIILISYLFFNFPSLLANEVKQPALISYNFKNVNIRAVFKLHFQHVNLNLAMSDEVKGNISLHLKKLEWNQALDAILKITGFEKWQSGNVVYIDTKAYIETMEKDKTYTEKPISVYFQDIDLCVALGFISELVGINLITTTAVTGKLDLRLNNVPWDQVLDIIGNMKRLELQQYDNNVLSVDIIKE